MRFHFSTVMGHPSTPNCTVAEALSGSPVSNVKRRGLFHTDLGGCEAAPIEALGAQAQRLDDLVLVAQSQLDR